MFCTALRYDNVKTKIRNILKQNLLTVCSNHVTVVMLRELVYSEG